MNSEAEIWSDMLRGEKEEEEDEQCGVKEIHTLCHFWLFAFGLWIQLFA